MHAECLDGDRIFVIHDFLGRDECGSFIARSEETGYDAAPISTAAGPVIEQDIRNNTRLVSDDAALSEVLWQRAQPFVPAIRGGWHVRGLNERFRFYRYDPGQKFAIHFDGFFRRGNDEQSQLTFMVYLNEEFTGGETKFYHEDRTSHVIVRPR